MERNYMALIEEFLQLRRIALFGMSRSSLSFSRMVAKDLLRRGYDIVPVNPNAEEIDGLRCLSDVAAVDPMPDAAVIMLAKERSASAVATCAEAGIQRVWLQRGSETLDALAIADEKNMLVVPGECILMHLPDTGLIHRIHRGIDKLTGRYPC